MFSRAKCSDAFSIESFKKMEIDMLIVNLHHRCACSNMPVLIVAIIAMWRQPIQLFLLLASNYSFCGTKVIRGISRGNSCADYEEIVVSY
jgi:hypothetical protein